MYVGYDPRGWGNEYMGPYEAHARHRPPMGYGAEVPDALPGMYMAIAWMTLCKCWYFVGDVFFQLDEMNAHRLNTLYRSNYMYRFPHRLLE